MKRFRFKLDVLMRLYGREEEARKKELGEANRLLLAAEQELTRLGAEYDAYQEKEAVLRTQGESVMEMRLYVQYIFDLKRRIEQKRDEVRSAMVRVKVCRDRLVEIKRKVKSIENIKQKRVDAWKKERNRFEMKTLDDLCGIQFLRDHTAFAARSG